MAPVVAAALISAAASMAKAEADKKAAASQSGSNNYQVDINPAGSSGGSGSGMQVGTYQAPDSGSGGNANGALIDAGSSVLQSVVNSKMQSSDERLKNIFGDNEDAIKCFANINAIKFTYNDKAQEIPGGEEKGIDNDPHYGVKAQELAENPLTESAVSKDPISEYLQVDTKELTMANTAIISEICKRILIIEKVLGIKVV